MGEEVLYVEKLQSLKELKSQQRVLSRCQWRLEQLHSEHIHSEHRVCVEIVERCAAQWRKLNEERESLVCRLREIDSDLQKVSQLSNQLSGEASLRAIAAPLDDYRNTLHHVNTTRHYLGMQSLEECRACSQLTQVQQSVQHQGADHPVVGKASKSHKSCPHCYKVVSRNATTCPGCSAPCSKKR